MRRASRSFTHFLKSIPVFFVLQTFGCYESILSIPKGAGNAQGDCDTCFDTDDTEAYPTVSRNYTGVDLLIAVDTSSSMTMTLEVLPTHIYSLIARLTAPIVDENEDSVPAVENLKVALVTADMGLQTGETGDTSLSPSNTAGCEALLGDNGAFQPADSATSAVPIFGEFLECDPKDRECPEGFYCTDDGTCAVSPGADSMLECTDHSTAVPSTSETFFNEDIAHQTACLSYRSTAACGYEQTLEAMLRGLEAHPSFVEEDHVLAVVIISDEDDCSIETPDLFSTPEWSDSNLANIACNANETDESCLFDPLRYPERLKALKGGREDAVVFAAFAGVPILPDKGNPCEGSGTHLTAAGCLDRSEMEPVPVENMYTDGNVFVTFRAVCTRYSEDVYESVFQDARPGRRFVRAAQAFGNAGMVFSICREDWSDGLDRITDAVSARIVLPNNETAR